MIPEPDTLYTMYIYNLYKGTIYFETTGEISLLIPLHPEMCLIVILCLKGHFCQDKKKYNVPLKLISTSLISNQARYSGRWGPLPYATKLSLCGQPRRISTDFSVKKKCFWFWPLIAPNPESKPFSHSVSFDCPLDINYYASAALVTVLIVFSLVQLNVQSYLWPLLKETCTFLRDPFGINDRGDS